MPNIVDNRLFVTGEDTKDFIMGIKPDPLRDGTPAMLSTYLPCTKELAEIARLSIEGQIFTFDSQQERLVRAYGRPNAETCVSDEYGWGDEYTSIKLAHEAAVLTFVSAASPPVFGVLMLSKMFPTLTFALEWAEVGIGLSGECVIRAGEVKQMLESLDFNFNTKFAVERYGEDPFTDDLP